MITSIFFGTEIETALIITPAAIECYSESCYDITTFVDKRKTNEFRISKLKFGVVGFKLSLWEIIWVMIDQGGYMS
jgi:hypothetical protein